MDNHTAPFDPGALYSPRSAVAHLRDKAPTGVGRAPVGMRFIRRLHAEGRLPAITLGGGRLMFTGQDLNEALEAMREVREPIETRAAERVQARIRREAEAKPRKRAAR